MLFLSHLLAGLGMRRRVCEKDQGGGQVCLTWDMGRAVTCVSFLFLFVGRAQDVAALAAAQYYLRHLSQLSASLATLSSLFQAHTHPFHSKLGIC